MDATHEEQLARILANRRSRGATAAGGMADLREPPAGVQRSGSEVRTTQPPPQVPPQQPYHEAPQEYVPAAGRSGGALATQRRSAFDSDIAAQPFAPSTAASERMSTVPSLLRSGSSLAAVATSAAAVHTAAGTAAATGTAATAVAAPPALQRAPSVMEELIGRRGTFDHFRDRPLLVSANIRSYSPPRRSSTAKIASPTSARAGVSAAPHHFAPAVVFSGVAVNGGGGGGGGAAAAAPSLDRSLSDAVAGGGGGKSLSATAAMSFSKQNPFRTQTFEDYCVAPHYDRSLPEEVVIPQHHRQRDAPSPLVTAMSSPPVGNPPLFDSQQAIAVLLQGDWFLKWTRIDSAHRRYVWLDLGRGVLSWASSRDASFFMQRSIKLEDIMDLRPACAVDEVAGRTFYKLIIVALDRELKIGTEIRDKFDVWFDTMQRLCEAQRTYTNTYIGRHAANNRLATSGGDFVRRVEASAATE